MRNNKKGFTLSEMLMVIAIIVILSGATAIGVVSWLNNAKNTAARLEQNNGDNFEKAARGEVESVRGTAGSHVVQQTNLNTPAPTAAPTSKPTDKPTSKPTDRPTDKPTDKPTTPPTATPTPAGGNNGGNSGGGAASVNNTITPNGSNIGISQVTNNSDGSTTLHFVHGNDVGDATIGKDANGYYIIVGDSKNMIGKVIGYNSDNSWLDSNKKLYIPSDQWSKLESTFGFKRS